MATEYNKRPHAVDDIKFTYIWNLFKYLIKNNIIYKPSTTATIKIQ